MCQEGSPRLLGDRPGCPEGSPAHWTGVCGETGCARPRRVEVDAPCCGQLALSLEGSHGSPARPPDPVLHPRQPTPAWKFPSVPLAIQGQALSWQTGALVAPGALAAPRLPARLSQAFCAPDLQLLHVKEA